MNDRREAARDLAADALRRRIGRDEIGVLGLDLLEFGEEAVVLGVGQVRLVEHVICVVRPLELGAQPCGALRRLAGGRFNWGSGHAGGTFS